MSKTIKREIRLDAASAVRVAKQLAGELRKTGKAANDVESAGRSAGGGMAKAAGNAIAKWLSLAAAVTAVTKAMAANAAERKRIEKQARDQAVSLTQAARGAGDLKDIEVIRSAMGAISTHGVGRQEGVGIYNAVRGALPNADVVDISQLVQHAGRSKMSGVEDPAQFGMIAAELFKAGAGKLTPRQAADASSVIFERLGRNVKKVNRRGLAAVKEFTAATGGDVTEGVGYLLAALEAASSTEPFETMTRTAHAEKTPGQIDAMKDPELQQFYRADAGDRFAAMAKNKRLRDKLALDSKVTAMLSLGPAGAAKAVREGMRRGHLALAADLALEDEQFAIEMGLRQAEAVAESDEIRRGGGLELAAERMGAAKQRQGGASGAEQLIGSAYLKGRSFLGLGPDEDMAGRTKSHAEQLRYDAKMEIVDQVRRARAEGAEVQGAEGAMGATGSTGEPRVTNVTNINVQNNLTTRKPEHTNYTLANPTGR